MSGNTRGKLKEHFEGIHRNLDWCLHHVNVSLALIDKQIRSTNLVEPAEGDEEKVKEIVSKYPLYVGIESLGKGIQTLDELAKGIYEKL